jgi:hypothetical protein
MLPLAKLVSQICVMIACYKCTYHHRQYHTLSEVSVECSFTYYLIIVSLVIAQMSYAYARDMYHLVLSLPVWLITVPMRSIITYRIHMCGVGSILMFALYEAYMRVLYLRVIITCIISLIILNQTRYNNQIEKFTYRLIETLLLLIIIELI